MPLLPPLFSSSQSLSRILLVLVLGACNGRTSQSADGGLDDDAGPTDAGLEEVDCDVGEAVFEQGRVHRVDLTIAPGDWSAMIQEAEESPEYDGPAKTYFSAAISYDDMQVGEIGVRVKGHYSLISALGHSFPLKLDFNRYVKGERLDGLKKLNLHPAGEAQSVLREHLSYGAIREMGVATARTSFVDVFVNGEELGLYSAVEQLGGKFIKCQYSEPRGDLYKPEEADGSLAYKGDRIENYPVANHKWPDETDHSAFLNLLDVINHGTLDEFPAVLDIQGVLTYLAANVAVGNFDYYATFGHNYYLYEITPGRFTMIPWDMNMSQFPFYHPCGGGRNTSEFPVSNRLLGDATYVAQYATILQGMLEGAASEARLFARLEEAVALLGNRVSEEHRLELRETISTRIEIQTTTLADLVVCPVSIE